MRSMHEILVGDALDRPSLAQYPLEHGVRCIDIELWKSRANVAKVDIAEEFHDLFIVLALRFPVLHRLQAEAHVGAAAAFITEHFEAARQPFVERLLDIRRGHEM